MAFKLPRYSSLIKLLVIILLITCCGYAQDNKQKIKELNLYSNELFMLCDKDSSLKALKLNDEAISLDSSVILLYANRVSIFKFLEDYSGIINTMNKIEPRFKDQLFIYYYRAEAYRELKDTINAKKDYIISYALSKISKIPKDQFIHYLIGAYLFGIDSAKNEIAIDHAAGKLNKEDYEFTLDWLSDGDDDVFFKTTPPLELK